MLTSMANTDRTGRLRMDCEFLSLVQNPLVHLPSKDRKDNMKKYKAVLPSQVKMARNLSKTLVVGGLDSIQKQKFKQALKDTAIN